MAASTSPGSRRPSDADIARARFEQSFAGRFWLRFHMAVMLTAAFSSGFLTNIALLRWPMHDVLKRWVLAFLVGYIVLFACMRVWLAYVGVRPFRSRARGDVDSGDVIGNVPLPGGSSSADVPFHGGGGNFGGGGASGGWGDGPSSAGGHSGSSGGGGVDLDVGDGFVVVLIVLALVAALSGGVLFLVASAPHLLVDVAFGAAVTSGLAPSVRRAAHPPAWEMSVWGATWKPFIAMLIVVVLSAMAFRHYYPGAMTLGEAWMFYR